MTEIAKTSIFVTVAVVIGLVAFFARPSLPISEPEDMVGKELFAEFTDPLKAASLEIIEYDENKAAVRPFKVAKVDNRWSIPSHEAYPTDAKDQLAEAATGLMGLEVLDVAGDTLADHELYGVVDPDLEKLEPGASGVGTRVTVADDDDKMLLSLIFGKEVPDSNGLRYVRRADQDLVYVVKVSTDKLSTRFEDWIEDDLLKLNSLDIQQVEVHDYSLDEARGAVDMRSRLKFGYDSAGNPKWKLAEDRIFQGRDWVDNPKPMTDAEELDTQKLDQITRALDDLKIVDVAKKPEGLGNNLRNMEAAEQFINNREAEASLQSRGFYLAKLNGRSELISNEGEIRCLTKEGVLYILRFGNIAGSGAGASASADADVESDDADDSGVNRYLFVMTEFNDAAFEKPDLEPLPEKPAESEKEKEAEEDDPAAEEKSDKQKEYEAEVARIERGNKQKQEEYDDKIKQGKERVKELNDRFADWYYIIAEDVYDKIHLGRDDVVKLKEEPKNENSGMPGMGAMPGMPPLGGFEGLGNVIMPPKDADDAEKPVDEKPAVKKPADEKPADEKPADEKPTTEADAVTEEKPKAQDDKEAGKEEKTPADDSPEASPKKPAAPEKPAEKEASTAPDTPEKKTPDAQK